MSKDRNGDDCCPCDNSIGENCEICYVGERATLPCISRHCSECGITECKQRGNYKEMYRFMFGDS